MSDRTRTTVPFWHWHRWTRWAEGIVTTQGRYVQTRRCIVCNKEQLRFEP